MNNVDTKALSNFLGREITLVQTRDINNNKPFLTDFVVDKNGYVKAFYDDIDVIKNNCSTNWVWRYSSNFFKSLKFHSKKQAFDFVDGKKVGVCEKSDEIKTYASDNGEIFVAYKGRVFTSGTWEDIKGFFGF